MATKFINALIQILDLLNKLTQFYDWIVPIVT